MNENMAPCLYCHASKFSCLANANNGITGLAPWEGPCCPNCTHFLVVIFETSVKI